MGAWWTAQTAPFHDAANGDSVHRPKLIAQRLPVANEPAAEHEVAEMQDTLLSELSAPVFSAGVWRTDQRRPFQRSMIGVSLRNESLGALDEPTARHKLAPTHDTLGKRSNKSSPEICCADHLRPFQRCAIGVPDTSPTAVQEVGDGHDTPESSAVSPS